MHRPKLMIKKKVLLDSFGHYRYYSALYNPERGKLKGFERPRSPIIDLEYHNFIQTERQLLLHLYNLFGEGEYLIFAFVKGKKGTWVFWKGVINKEGFLRERRITSYRKEVDKIKKQLVVADEEEKEDLNEQINVEKEYRNESMYGCSRYLKLSSRIGMFCRWDDIIVEEKPKFEIWGSNTKKTTDNSWGVNISRAKDTKKQFEVWR